MNTYEQHFKLGLLGNPIARSLSPKIHLISAKTLKIKSSYELFELKENEISYFLKNFWKIGGSGLNITSPFKQWVAQNILDSHYSGINTLYRGKNGWQGCSTDGAGFINSLKRQNIKISDFEQIIILGSGGAVISIFNSLIKHVSHKKIYIFRRNPKNDLFFKTSKLNKNLVFINEFNIQRIKAQCSISKNLRTITIQGTSSTFNHKNELGIKKIFDDYYGFFYELNYGKYSLLLDFAKQKKIAHCDGLPMLIEQALLSQNFWWQKSANYEQVIKTLGTNYSND